MVTEQDILDALADLDKQHFDVHVIDNAWYSVPAITSAMRVTKNS